MALSDFILNKGELVVLLGSSDTGITTAEGGKALNFGSIQKVNDLSDYTVGDNIQFSIDDAVPFTIISGNVFYLIKEDSVRFTEITPP